MLLTIFPASLRPPSSGNNLSRVRNCLPVLLVFLTACAGLQPKPLPPTFAQDDCVQQYALLESTIVREGVQDASVYRMAGLPFFRSNRFLASFITEIQGADSSKIRQWLEHLNDLANEGYLIEWQRALFDQGNLNKGHTQTMTMTQLKKILSQCGPQVVALTMKHTQVLERVYIKALVPPAYQDWKRYLGLYPLVKYPFLRGVRKEQRDIMALQTKFNPADPSYHWKVYRSVNHLSLEKPPVIFAQTDVDVLGIPHFSQERQTELLSQWAPTWLVDERDSNDMLGTLQLDSEGQARVDSQRPVFYTSISYGRYNNQITTQLNYTVWFPGRKKSGIFDLLWGQIDGLTWRVHLNAQGELLAFDTMHNCGCWYQMYLPPNMSAKSPNNSKIEPVFIRSLNWKPRGALAIYLDSNRHFIMAVDKVLTKEDLDASQVENLRAVPYSELRKLAVLRQNGPVALFSPSGLIPASVRGERWLFWPMGIASPGTMRVMGTHAIAFVGKRHFDDPNILNSINLHSR